MATTHQTPPGFRRDTPPIGVGAHRLADAGKERPNDEAEPQVAARRRSLETMMDDVEHHGGGPVDDPADRPHPWS